MRYFAHNNHHVFLILALAFPLLTGCSRSPAVSPELATALRLIHEGSYRAASELLQELAANDPEDPAVYANLGVAHWRLGEIELAVPAFNRAASLTPQDQRPVQIMARLFMERRNPEGALAVLDDVPHPDFRTLTFKAMAYYRAGRTEQAMMELNRVREIKPNYPPVLYNLATLHRDIHLDAESALRYYTTFRKGSRTHPLAQRQPNAFLAVNPRLAERSAQTDPSPPKLDNEAYHEGVKAARHAAKEGDYEMAVILYEKAINERPDLPDALWEMADIFEKHLEFPARAQALRTRFRRLFPEDSRGAGIVVSDAPPTQRAQDFFDEGMAHMEAERWRPAAVAFRRSMDLDPESGGAAYNLGLAEYRRGNSAAAVAAWEKAAAIDPNLADAFYMIAQVERERGNHQRAIARLNHLLRRQPDYASAHMLLGLIYREQDRPREATVHFEQVVTLAPDSDTARFARAWLEQHRPQENN